MTQFFECPALPLESDIAHYPVTRFSFVSVKNGVPVKKLVIGGASPTTSYSWPRIMSLSRRSTVYPAGKNATKSTTCRWSIPFNGSLGDGTSTPTLDTDSGSANTGVKWL